jgi:enoyl-CoA hydratase
MRTIEEPDQATGVLCARQRGRVRWLWLNRPKVRNALNAELITSLRAAVTDAEQDATVDVLVIAGTGASFCAGADLRYLLCLAGPTHPVDFLTTVSDCFTAISRSPLTVIAAVHGHAVAGGLELALSCDLVVAEAGTLIGDGHVRNNLVPAGGSTVRLRRRVGDSLARRLLLTGELLPVEQLSTSGFITAIAKRGQLYAEVDQLARRLPANRAAARASIKHVLGMAETDQLLAAELDAFRTHWDTEDVRAALTAFLDQRGAP